MVIPNINPNYMPIIVARKPIDGSIVYNIEKYGVGGINIDECRVGFENGETNSSINRYNSTPPRGNNGWQHINRGANFNEDTKKSMQLGRFPANTILTYSEEDKEEVIGGFPNTKTTVECPHYYNDKEYKNDNILKNIGNKPIAPSNYGDEGSASRYFKNCKYTSKDINERLESKVSENEKTYKIINGNMLEELDKLEENSVDAVVTDPPYELNFMNKGWDNAGISFQKETWKKCLRVLKPRRTFVSIWWFKNFP